MFQPHLHSRRVNQILSIDSGQFFVTCSEDTAIGVWRIDENSGLHLILTIF